MAHQVQVFVRVWLVAFALCLGEAPAASLASATNGIEADETVVIRSTDGPVVHIGAGVIVGTERGHLLIATAAHVLASGTPTVQLDSGDIVDVVKVEPIPGFDLAVVETSWYAGHTSVAIASTPALGEHVHIWGHRLQHDYVESNASVTDLDPALPEGPADGRFAIDCGTCDHGDSGGGVFDDSGRLLGILEGVRRDRSGRIAFVQVEPIGPLETDLQALL